MSSLDINKIVNQLQSSKTKDRNSALSLLQTISSSKLKLNLKQFGILTASLFKLIEIERSAYGANLTNPVESRLSIASNFLTSLVERCFTYPSIVKLKYKNCITIINSILDNFYVAPKTFLEPTAFDFLSILNILLQQSVVRENYEFYWEKIFNFVVGLSNHLLESFVNGNTNTALHENLLTQCLSGLKYLIDTSPRVSRLHILSNNLHLKLLPTIENVAKMLEKRENNLIIVLMEIINKCLIVLSNEDAKFLYQLIKVTVKLFVQFVNTHYESLKVQFLIFLNLESVHNYINYPNLAEITGHEKIIDETFVYNIGVLIQNLISKSQSPEYHFNNNDIGVVIDNSQDQTWFNLKTIFFRPRNSDIQSHSWLLHQGISKLITAYYELNLSLDKRNNLTTSNILEDHFDSRHNSKSKRQKLGIIADSLYSSHNTVQFLNTLINHKEDERIQATALKILVFYLETEIPSNSKPPIESETSSPTVDELDDFSFNCNESSLFNSTFKQHQEDKPSQSESDKSVIFKTILSSFDNSELSYWSLLASSSLLYNINENEINEHPQSYHRLCHLLLNLCLPLIKSKDFGHVACNLVYLMITFQKETEYLKLVNNSILNQLDSIIDLSEVNGPNTIRDESFGFWYALDAVLIETQSSKRLSLRESVFRWLAAKWDECFLKSSEESTANLSLSTQLPQLVAWLASKTPDISKCFTTSERCSGLITDYFYLMNQYSKLQRYTNLKQNHGVKFVYKHLELSIVEGTSTLSVETLFGKIIETSDFFQSPILLLHWSILLYEVIECLEPASNDLRLISLFESKITTSLQIVSELKLNSEDILEVIHAVNSLNEKVIDRINLMKFAYLLPFETLIDNYFTQIKSRDLQLRENDNNNFDIEFKSTSPLPPADEAAANDLSLISLVYHDNVSADILKFILRSNSWRESSLELTLNKLLEYLHLIGSKEQLYGLYNFFSLIEEDNQGSTKEIPSKLLIKLVRFIGEGPMVDDKTEHSELTVIVLCKLLKFLGPHLKVNADESLRQDCTDLFEYLIKCYHDDLVVTENALLEVCLISLSFSTASGVILFEPRAISTSFNQIFGKATKNIKVSILPFLRAYMNSCPELIQVELYKSCLIRFDKPESSVESSSTFSLFCSQLAPISPHITTFAIYNLIEYSQFKTCVPYCELSLYEISISLGMADTQSLFQSFKFEILKCWLHRDSLENFPFSLFGYPTYDEFSADNFREIVALVVSTTANEKTLYQLSKLNKTDIQSLIYDSLPFCIALSFTPSCIRDGIFKKLEGYLPPDKFKGEMRKQIVIIVLQILIQTDVKSGKTSLQDSKISKLRSANLSSLSLDSSESLLKAVIEKYHGAYFQFWLTQVQYFLIRRISLLLKETVRMDQKVNYLKVIQWILQLSNSSMNDIKLFRLVIDIITPYLVARNELTFIAFEILTMLKLENMSRFEASEVIPSIICLISEQVPQLCQNGYKPEYQNLGNSIEQYSGTVEISSSMKNLLQRSSSFMLEENGNASLTSTEIEQILGNQKEMSYFVTTREKRSLLQVISLVFRGKSNIYEARRSQTVVKLLLDVKISDDSPSWKNLNIWSLEYLGAYFLEGGINERINEFVDLNEYHGVDVEAVDESTKKMNGILDLITSSIASEDEEIAACSEIVIGVLIWKYNENQTSVLNYIDFDSYYNQYGTFIQPIDFHGCTILYPIGEKAEILLKTVIEYFPATFENESFDSWTSTLLMSFLGELSRITDIAKIFMRYVDKVKTFAKKALPDFICYYLSFLRTAGVTTIIKLFLQYVNSSPSNNELIDLFTRVLLQIRMAAKNKNQIFRLLYSKLNVRELSKLACKNKLYKTSLMLYEDSHENFDDPFDNSDTSSFLLNIYESIDDDDLVYGLPEETSLEHALRLITRNDDPSSRIIYDSGYLDAKSLLKQPLNDEKILSSLIGNGSLGISRLLSKSLETDQSSANYEWAWKLNTWDIPVPKRSVTEHEIIYKALKQCHDSFETAPEILQQCQLEAVSARDLLASSSLSAKELRLNTLEWFKSLASLTAMAMTVKSSKDLTIPKDLNNFSRLTSWFDSSELAMSESITLSRMSILNILSNVTDDIYNERDLRLGLISEIVRYGCITRLNKATQKMVSSTILMDEVVKTSKLLDGEGESMANLCKFHTASTLWEQGHTTAPVVMVKELFTQTPEPLPIQSLNIERGLKGATLVKWMSESRQELAVNILGNYVSDVNTMIHEATDMNQKVQMNRLLAHFCEEQFKSHNLNEMISKLEKRTAEKKAEIDELKNHFRKLVLSSDEKLSVQRYYSKLKVQYNSDVKETESLVATRIDFRDRAIKYFLRSIIIDGSTGEDLDKFFSMFFEFSNEDGLQKSLIDDLDLLPSFKLIGWCTQLVSRIGSESTHFQISLRSLIVKLCHDHPFHSLYQLVSLRKHESFAATNKNNIMLSKVTVANEIWYELQSKSSTFARDILNPVDRLCDEAIKLAEYKGVKGRSVQLQRVSIGSYWMTELPAIPPPTLNLPVSFNGYSRVTCMQSIDSKLTIAMSGLSLPKIANINLSDGTVHKVLFKSGTDDLRQDSIMEQVFEKVNNIFSNDRDTRKRGLRVRTYKAVPLGPQAGIIEFVPNSEALIDIIKPYHTTLDKMKADRAKQLMKEDQSTDVVNRHKVYDSIAAKIKPVLRHFFFDRFVTPDEWFSSRSRYTRGTATNSMVGYMLGLGDRHCNNILIDTNTGEPIHIDLGVAFDQGKRLPIPETVPFRLTRDIVDGFGITGTKGAFSKSCEHTFRVLRSNKEHILAILDVLRWDPLYNWSISPIRKKKLQDETTDIKRLEPMDDASEAGLAVTTVGDKLVGEGLSVEATVRELIQEATSPKNLSLIYCGWSPFF